MEQIYLSRQEAADYLKIPYRTLAEWAHCRKNLPYRKHGKRAVYLKADLDAWSQANEIKPLRFSGEEVKYGA